MNSNNDLEKIKKFCENSIGNIEKSIENCEKDKSERMEGYVSGLKVAIKSFQTEIGLLDGFIKINTEIYG